MDPITIAAIIAAGGAISAPIVAHLLARRRRKTKDRIVYRACVVLGGIGETGKSTMIQSLLPGIDAHAGTRTQRPTVYWDERNIPGESMGYCRTALIDYRGQDTSQLTSVLGDEDLAQYPPTAFVLMVDPFANESPGAEEEADKFRIAKHLGEWSGVAIQSLAGLLNSVHYVCLFVNKIDALNSEARTSIEEPFLPLLQILKDSYPGIEVHLIKGSTLEGTGLPTLQEGILESRRKIP